MGVRRYFFDRVDRVDTPFSLFPILYLFFFKKSLKKSEKGVSTLSTLDTFRQYPMETTAYEQNVSRNVSRNRLHINKHS
jgi:hypothetical protein